MGAQIKTFYCLRCQHRFKAEHDPKVVMERSCAACGSNSVRLETPAAAKRSVQPKTTPEEVNP